MSYISLLIVRSDDPFLGCLIQIYDLVSDNLSAEVGNVELIKLL